MSLARLSRSALRLSLPFALPLVAFACDGETTGIDDTDAQVDASEVRLGALTLDRGPVSPASSTPIQTSRPSAATASEGPLVVHLGPGAAASAPSPNAPTGLSPAELSPAELERRLHHAELELVQAIDAVRAAIVGEALRSDSRWFVHDGALVLSLAEGETVDPLHGAAFALPTGEGVFAAARPLDLAAVPLAHRALIGHTVRLFGLDREQCVATVTHLALEAHLTHEPELQWDDDGDELPPTPQSYTPEEVFAHGAVMLKARLRPLFGSCEGALWASPTDGPRPVIYRPVPLAARSASDRALTRRAIGAFRQTSVWSAAQARYLAQLYPGVHRPSPRWDTHESSGPEVTRFVGDDGDTLIQVSADTWQGCGDPGERGVALFRLENGTLRFVTGATGETAPAALVDLDRDGQPEVLYTSGDSMRLGRWTTTPEHPATADEYDTGETLEHFYVPDFTMHGCGC